MFPKRCKSFPGGDGIEVYRRAVATALRAELGDSHHAVKTVMQRTGANERTVKNWLSGKRGPRGEHLVCLLHHSDNVLQGVLQLAGREHAAAGTTVLNARNVLADILEKLDTWLANRNGSVRRGA
jgi:hypothetical protein